MVIEVMIPPLPVVFTNPAVFYVVKKSGILSIVHNPVDNYF
jgi:hypothetical protein